MTDGRTVVTSGSLVADMLGPESATVDKPTAPAPVASLSTSASTSVASGADDGAKGTAADEAARAAEAAKNSNAEPPKKRSIVAELVHTRAQRNDARASEQALASENAALRAELDRVKQQQSTLAAQPEAVDPGPKPERGRFVSDEDYLLALADWAAETKIADAQRATMEARGNAQVQQVNEEWSTRLTQAKASIPDYETVVSGANIALPNYLYGAIVESDLGPQLAYYLASNPDEAKLLVGLTPIRAVQVLGKLEDRLREQADSSVESSAADGGAGKQPAAEKHTEKPKATQGVREVPAVSKAPPPIDPVGGGAAPDARPAQETYPEYKARRQAELRVAGKRP